MSAFTFCNDQASTEINRSSRSSLLHGVFKLTEAETLKPPTHTHTHTHTHTLCSSTICTYIPHLNFDALEVNETYYDCLTSFSFWFDRLVLEDVVFKKQKKNDFGVHQHPKWQPK